jgi:hypothetical protein
VRTPTERAVKALARIPSVIVRQEIADALEALADAVEFQPAGAGSRDGAQSAGFESSVPSALRLLAAQVEREARRTLNNMTDGFRKELRRVHSEAAAFRGVAKVYESRRGPGRPSLITSEMLAEAHRYRSSGFTADASIRALCVKFAVSESALRSNLRRGTVPESGGPNASRLLFLAVYGDTQRKATTRVQALPQTRYTRTTTNDPVTTPESPTEVEA